MESVIRGLIVYVFLLVIFRISGKRTLAQTSGFELVLLLIISETTQQAMVDNDHSITNAFLLITTLTGATVLLSWVKFRWKAASRWLDGVPVQIMADGRLLHDRMRRARIDEDDILAAGRVAHGLERLDDIRHAAVEDDGTISVVPWRNGDRPSR